jgi:hypothetical protein
MGGNMYKFGTVILLILIFSKLGFPGELKFPPDHYILKNIESGVKKGKRQPQILFCRGFTLNEKQIKEYFSKANIIDEYKANHEYDWAPCYVRGTMEWDHLEAKWEINALQTAVVRFKNGDVLYFICKGACDHMFIQSPN